MSRFFSGKYARLTPYTPGEQPQDRQYIKLNTNESPFPPSPMAQRLARLEAGELQLYSDPACKKLVSAAAEAFGVRPDEIMFTNGSDDILNFAVMAFCDADHPAVFPDVTYGLYSVLCAVNGVRSKRSCRPIRTAWWWWMKPTWISAAKAAWGLLARTKTCW